MTQKWRYFTGSHQEVAVEGWELAFCVSFSSYRSVTRRRWQSRGRKWCHGPHVTGSDPEVMSFHRKSPGSGCRSPTTCFLGKFELLGGNLQETAVTWQKMTSRDLTWPEVTRKSRYWLEVTRKWLGKAQNSCLSSYKAITRRRGSHVRGNDVTWPHVTGSDPKVTSFHQKSPGSGCRSPQLVFWVHLSSYGVVTCRRRQSRDKRWSYVIGSYPKVTLFDWKSPGRGWGRPRTRVLATFELLQGCNSKEGQSHERKWHHVTSQIGSDTEVTSIHLMSAGSGCRRPRTLILDMFEPLHCCNLQEVAVMWQKMMSVTSRDRKGPVCDLIWPEVTRKLL